MKDEEFKTEYEKLKPRYDVISQIIEARTSQNTLFVTSTKSAKIRSWKHIGIEKELIYNKFRVRRVSLCEKT
jgi:hypothetical protein